MVNKRGLSEIVTTLIMVLLGIVIVGVIWAVVSGLVNNTRTQAELNTKCQDSTISITYANCSAADYCIVTIKRDQGTDPIVGLTAIAIGSQGQTKTNSTANVLPIGTSAQVNISGISSIKNITRIDASVLLDNRGKNFTCNNPATTINIIS